MKIEFKNVTKKFGDEEIIKNFSYVFDDKKTNFIIGPSGIGKTTIMRIILGLEKSYSGEVSGLEGLKKSAVFQDDCLCDNLSVYLNIRLVTGNTDKEGIKNSLEEMGLGEVLNKRARELSGGMKRRVAILRALSADFDTLIMDEPFKGLDRETKEKIMEIVIRETGEKTIILVTHDVEELKFFSKRCSTKVLNMNDVVSKYI